MPLDSLVVPPPRMDLFHVVLVPDIGDPHVEHFPTAEAMAGYLKTLRGHPVQAFPFNGEQLHITKGPGDRFLLLPDGSRYPLFDTQVTLEIDPKGYLDSATRPK